MPWRSGPVLTLLACLLLTPGGAVAASQPADAAGSLETFHFEWRLEGLTGVLARVLKVLPAAGTAVLTVTPSADGRLSYTFRATSPRAAEGEHWTYAAELDPRVPRTIEVTDTLRYRERDRVKRHTPEGEVVDVLSGLFLLRDSRPREVERRVIWSDRKLYTVSVEPAGRKVREVRGERRELDHFVIRGVREPGKRFWSSEAEVWTTPDAEALPVEMVYRRRFALLRLLLVEE